METDGARQQGTKCDISVTQSTNTRIKSLPFRTGRCVTKSRDNPPQGDVDRRSGILVAPQCQRRECHHVPIEHSGAERRLGLYKTKETKGSGGVAGISCNNIHIIGRGELRAMIRNSIGVHSDEVGKQSVDRRGEKTGD